MALQVPHVATKLWIHMKAKHLWSSGCTESKHKLYDQDQHQLG